ncbi:MAG: response regulator transcription factor [Betaproteobacteria bacterium]
MRAILAGPAAERDRVREAISRTLDVVAEYPSLAAARASGIDCDVIVLAGQGAAPAHDEALAVEEPLTPRELDVLERLAEGLPNKAIAARLGISDQTVKFHVASICGKLGAANRTDAVRRAVRRGLIAL